MRKSKPSKLDKLATNQWFAEIVKEMQNSGIIKLEIDGCELAVETHE